VKSEFEEKVKQEPDTEQSEKPSLLENITLSRTICLPAKLIKTVYADSNGNKLERLVNVIKVSSHLKCNVFKHSLMTHIQDNCKENETLAESFSERINEVQTVINTLETIDFGTLSSEILMYNVANTSVATDVPDVSEVIVPQMLPFGEQYHQRNPIIMLTTTEEIR